MAILTEQFKIDPKKIEIKENLSNSNLSIVFGNSSSLSKTQLIDQITESCKSDIIVFCSTSGHFIKDEITENEIVVNRLTFEKTKLQYCSINITDVANDQEAGEYIVKQLLADDLCHILLFADGHVVNGDNLVKGINAVIPKNITLSGGIAGDGVNFKETFVGVNDYPKSGSIVAVGFYGTELKVSSSFDSGFQIFGPKRSVTESNLNTLKKLDGRPALDLYKEYLGELSENLPGSALYFPIAIFKNNKKIKVRTILSVDEKENTMTFAGNFEKNDQVSLMRSNIHNLLDASEDVLEMQPEEQIDKPQFILVTSCVGRKIIMENRISEELWAVNEKYNSAISGFYSYGEICSSAKVDSILLHNQTFVVTLFQEL